MTVKNKNYFYDYRRKKETHKEIRTKEVPKTKGDPVLYAQYQLKNKAKYEKRKAQKKVISIKYMTPRAKRAQRKKWREAFNAYYKRKQRQKHLHWDLHSPPDSEDEENRNSTSPSILSPSIGNKENTNPNLKIKRSQESPLSDRRSQVSEISSVSSRVNSPSQSMTKLRYKKEKEIKALTRELEAVKKVNEAYRKKLRRLVTEEKEKSSMDIINDKLLQI